MKAAVNVAFMEMSQAVVNAILGDIGKGRRSRWWHPLTADYKFALKNCRLQLYLLYSNDFCRSRFHILFLFSDLKEDIVFSLVFPVASAYSLF